MGFFQDHRGVIEQPALRHMHLDHIVDEAARLIRSTSPQRVTLRLVPAARRGPSTCVSSRTVTGRRLRGRNARASASGVRSAAT